MEESLTRTFLGEFFWVLIPCKQHQNASGCGTYNLFAKVIGQLSSQFLAGSYLMKILHKGKKIQILSHR